MKSLRFRQAQLVAFVKRVGRIFIKSQILTIWVGLCGLGYLIGSQARPEPGSVPFEELFENLRVYSFREAPSDSTVHFMVELSARGRPFRQYDVDAKQFVPASQGHEYWRSINATSYSPLEVRGHVTRGVWLEIPNSAATPLVPDEFDELFSSTLNLVNPVSVATSALGMLSGYSVGYRLATWGHSLSSPKVQDRVLATPGIGRIVAREAWRRVALEPAVVFAEKNSGRFAAVRGRQRLYANFFRVALNDSNGFVPYEVARLTAAGAEREARAMSSFATAARRAAQDSCDLTSVDFSAVEEWASLLDRRGHWATGTIPPPGPERIAYLGALSWYGLVPEGADEHRIWIGPRLLVRTGDAEGFVPDEIPRLGAACPVAWQPWLMRDKSHLGSNAWTAQWMGHAREFAPILDFGAHVVSAVSGRPPAATGPSRVASRAVTNARASGGAAVEPNAARAPDTTLARGDSPAAGIAAASQRAEVADSASTDRPSIALKQQRPDSVVIRSGFVGFGR